MIDQAAIIEQFTPLLWKLARKVTRDEHLRDDLRQVGAIRLMELAKTYDPAKSSFLHYAYKPVYQEMLREWDRARVIRISRYALHGSDKAKADRERVLQLLPLTDPGVLDAIDHRTPRPDAIVCDAGEQSAAMEKLHRMDERTRKVCLARLDGQEFKDIGRMIGKTKQRANQIFNRAMETLREQVA